MAALQLAVFPITWPGSVPTAAERVRRPPTTRRARALEWFAAAVPERTLHNWQNEAASLIAGYLRELGNPPA